MIEHQTAASAAVADSRRRWRDEFKALLALGWPLVAAQLAQHALFLTDVILMGWLGPAALAAGALATTFMNTFLIGCIALVSVVAALVAQARGARDIRGVRRTVRQGLWVSIALSAVMMPVVWQIQPILLALGQEPVNVERATEYVHIAAFLFLPALGYTVLRSFLSALGDTRAVLVVTVAAIVLNALLDYALIFGNFGFPRMELRGAALATLLVNIAMFAMLLAYVLLHPRHRRFHILLRFWKPDWSRFRKIVRIGLPIGLMVLSEVGLFTAAAILMGMLGTNELAAHTVALQCASTAFMVPLGLSQATTVRVGVAYGRQDPLATRRAGWTGLAITMAFMSCTALLFLSVPHVLVGFFLDTRQAENTTALTLAATYVVVAGLFQLVDGAQVSAAAALRGLSDTTVAMAVALVGYWLVGLPVAWICGFVFEMRGVGIWIGLATGLAFVALVLNLRFHLRSRIVAAPA